jgi:hypothetical protein
VCQIHAILGLTHCQAQEPWTRLTTTFKRIGFDIRVDPRYFRLGVSPNTLDLTCVPEPHHLGLGTLPSPNALDLAKCHVQMLHTAQQEPWTRLITKFKRIGFDIHVDPRHLRLDVLPSPNTLDLTKCHVQMYWVWHACQNRTTLDLAQYLRLSAL